DVVDGDASFGELRFGGGGVGGGELGFRASVEGGGGELVEFGGGGVGDGGNVRHFLVEASERLDRYTNASTDGGTGGGHPETDRPERAFMLSGEVDGLVAEVLDRVADTPELGDGGGSEVGDGALSPGEPGECLPVEADGKE